MTGYLMRLARQSRLVPGPLAVPSDSAQVELRDHESPTVAESEQTDANVDAPRPEVPATEFSPVSSERAAPRPSEEPHSASVPGDARSAPTDMLAAERRPTEGDRELRARIGHQDPSRATARDAVQRVVEWIAAGPQPPDPERHGVLEEKPGRLVTSEPPYVTVPRTAARSVPVRSASNAERLPDSLFNEEPRTSLAIDDRIAVAPPGRSVEPARPRARDESSEEALSVSIGSIHVTVEAPPAAREPAPPPPAAPAPRAAAPRLARHYVRAL